MTNPVCEARSPPERLPGIPWLLLLMVLPFAPFFLSGIVRATLGVKTGLSLAIATAALLVPALAVASWLRRKTLVFERRVSWLAGTLLLLGLILSTWGLWTSWFSGLPSVGGGDAGIHLVQRRIFLSSNPRVYNTFITFYAVTYWIERVFGMDAFGSIRLVFYLVVGSVWLALVAAVVVVVQSAEKRAQSEMRSTLLLLFLTFASAIAILLPLLHYYQADGFYAVLFGVAPLMMAWIAYGIVESAFARIVILAIWIVAERFTYGINLGDGLLVSAALVIWEGWRRRGIGRWLALAFAAVAIAATTFFWRQVASYVQPVGASYSIRINLVLIGEAMLSAFLVIIPSFVPPGRRSSLGRLAHFAGANGIFNVADQLLWLGYSLPVGYHFFRYSMHASLLLTVAAVALGPIALRDARVRYDSFAVRALGSLLLAGLIALGCAFPRHQDSFFERMLKGPPWHHLKPLADIDGMARIRQIMAQGKKRCAVVLAPSWPMVQFMNASLDCPLGPAWDGSMNTDSWSAPGNCTFWYGSSQDIADMGRYAVPHDPRKLSSEDAARNQAHVALGLRIQQMAQDLKLQPRAVCEKEYTARWDPLRQVQLCYMCF